MSILIDIITLSSESDDNSDSSCESEENSGVTKTASEIFSSRDTSEESENTDCVKKTATVDLTTSDYSSGVQITDKDLYVHTTQLEDMLILKNNFHIYVPNNVIRRIEIESKPKTFRQRKKKKKNIKAIARVRYNLVKLREYAKLKEEAIKNNYYDMLKMCKPLTINLTKLKYDGKYEILKEELCKSYNVTNEGETHINCNAKVNAGTLSPTRPLVDPKVGSFLSKDIVHIDSRYNNLPLESYNIEDTRNWCAQTMRQVIVLNASKKRYSKNSRSSTIVTFFELATTVKDQSIHEYYLIGLNGDVESYHLVDDMNLVISTKSKLEADLVFRGYQYVNSVVASVRCWYGRKDIVNSCNISESAKNFIKGDHSCSFNHCECCCNPLRIKRTKNDPPFKYCKKLFKVKRKKICKSQNSSQAEIHVSSQNSPQTASKPVIKKVKNVEDINDPPFEYFKKLFKDKGMIICKRQDSTQADIHIASQKAPQTASKPVIKKVKNVEDINREYAERNIYSNNLTPIANKDNPPTIQTIINNNISSNIVNSVLVDTNMALSKEAHEFLKPMSSGYVEKSVNNSNNSEPSIVKLPAETINKNPNSNLVNQILQNHELQALIRKILQQFKNTKIIINTDGQLAAHITKTPDGNAFSPAEIQIFGSLMEQAQNMVNSLSLPHKSNLPIEKPLANIAPKCSTNTSNSGNTTSLNFVHLCEMSSEIARMKRKDYLLNLYLLKQQQSTTTNKPNKNKSKTCYLVSPKPFLLIQSALNHQFSKNEKIIPRNAEVANTEPNKNNTNIASSSKMTQQNVKTSHYVTLIPQNTSVQTQDLFSIHHSNEPKVIPVVVPTAYSSVATNKTDKIGNQFPLHNNVNMNQIYVPVDELKKNLNMVSNVGTNVNITTSSVYLQSIPGSTTHVPNNSVTDPSSNFARKKTTLQTKQNRDVNVPFCDTSNTPRFVKEFYQDLNSNQNSKSEHTNIDWESQIVCNSVVATSSDIATVDNNKKMSSTNESTMPKISNVFTLNAAALSSKSVPTEVWISDSD